MKIYPYLLSLLALPANAGFMFGGGGNLAVGNAIGSGTNGSVLFVRPTGTIAQDNTNFFWDDVNNRLGITDTTPDFLLDVNGTLGVAGATTLSGTLAAGATTVTGNLNATGEVQSAGSRIGYTINTVAAGTVYALTNAAATLDFGTTDPTIIIDKAGTYLIFARVMAKYNAATFAANQTLTCKLRRTNNTAADVTNSTTAQTLRIITTITDGFEVPLPPVIYTTTNTDDVIAVQGLLSAVPAVGSVDMTEAAITAIRLY